MLAYRVSVGVNVLDAITTDINCSLHVYCSRAPVGVLYAFHLGENFSTVLGYFGPKEHDESCAKFVSVDITPEMANSKWPPVEKFEMAN